MQLEIISPDKNIFSGHTTSIVVPAVDGLLGILENHAALISTLKEGKVEIKDEKGATKAFEIRGGVVEVLNNKVVILAD